MALLEIRGLGFDTAGRRILRRIDLAVDSGEVHALLGTNGTGKSTLAALIMGCQGFRPTSGRIHFAGRVIDRLPLYERARLGIAMAWQEPVRFEGISVQDFLGLGRTETNPSESLRMVGLEPSIYLERMVDRTLSGGERKRIELASLVALAPRLAILDEPDSGIDLLSLQGIVDVIEAFRRHGTAVLLITHREEIARIADRGSYLCGGRIVCQGPSQEVADHFLERRCLRCDGRECGHDRE